MCQGRCAGCGRTGPDKAVTSHIVSCAEWGRLYREEPARALDPKEEYERWRRDDRAGEHAALVQQLRGASEAKRAVQADRFAYRDPLEDD